MATPARETIAITATPDEMTEEQPSPPCSGRSIVITDGEFVDFSSFFVEVSGSASVKYPVVSLVTVVSIGAEVSVTSADVTV